MSAHIAAICICASYVSWWPDWLISNGSWLVLGIVVVGFIFTGILFGSNKYLLTVLSFLLLYFIFAIMYTLAQLVNWERPSYANGACVSSSCDGQLGYLVLNRYAYPEPFFQTALSFAIVYLYVYIYIYRKPTPYLLIIVGSLYLIVFTILELVGQRQSIGQYIANLATALLISLPIGLMARFFYPAFRWLQKPDDVPIEAVALPVFSWDNGNSVNSNYNKAKR